MIRQAIRKPMTNHVIDASFLRPPQDHLGISIVQHPDLQVWPSTSPGTYIADNLAYIILDEYEMDHTKFSANTDQ